MLNASRVIDDRVPSPECVARARWLAEGVHRKRFFARRLVVDDAMVHTLAYAMCAKPPVLRMFYLWGVYRKAIPDQSEQLAMDFLDGFVAHVATHFGCRIKMELVLSDTHGLINGIPPAVVRRYSEGIGKMASRRGWSTVLMSSLLKKYGIRESGGNESVPGWGALPQRELLVRFAKMYYLAGDPETGAERYVAARLREKPMLEREFADGIMVTCADHRLGFLQPALPSMWVWSTRKGRSKKPWFMFDQATCAG